MANCRTCYWYINFPAISEWTPPHEELPAVRYCSHPRHTGPLLPVCEDHFNKRGGDIPLTLKRLGGDRAT
mgnify:CR=1 FL=1